MPSKLLTRLSVAFMLAVVLFGSVCLDLFVSKGEKNPYKYHYERDGVHYYLHCTDERCTLVTESEVPEKWRKP